jgi:hypothetical protein
MINQYMHANAGEDLSNSINDNQDLSKAKKIALRKNIVLVKPVPKSISRENEGKTET